MWHHASDACHAAQLADNANTWHRSGLNVSAGTERATCLHAFTPEWVLPKTDQMASHQNFVRSGQYALLNEREQADCQQLWVGKLTEQRGALGPMRVAGGARL